jgi:hypothetical protein
VVTPPRYVEKVFGITAFYDALSWSTGRILAALHMRVIPPHFEIVLAGKPRALLDELLGEVE